jgi:hypothetical protein
MTLFERRSWRDQVRDKALEDRLSTAGCPLSLDDILATIDVRPSPLRPWVKAQLGAGVMFRTGQAEHIALDGESITETALATGVTVERVLYYLTEFESDEEDVGSFYDVNGSA